MPQHPRRIATIRGTFEVLTESAYGEPLTVQHVEPYMRGSVIEAITNSAFAMRQCYHAFHESMPTFLARLTQPPEPWWRESPEAGDTEAQLAAALVRLVDERRALLAHLSD